ncbi:hypothetical protein [Massilia phyllosphaerae]|uniref:hypothetical protein n=1 Tax=Massilia phyllosphaerae TaxID=3106034 RepID=UPI002B1CAACA|nr:hypothetical protein [Massilia sp. SGZ-792]
MTNRITQRIANDAITQGFQFARYERFSLSPKSTNKSLGHHHADYGKTRSGNAWSVSDILREAAREPVDWKKHFPHVIEPQPPTVAYGCHPLEVEEIAKHWITTVKQSNGKKMRSDTPCMVAGVISWPPHRSVEEFNEFLAYSVENLKEIYGERLRSVVAHYDELTDSQGALHLHFYSVPLDGEDFGMVDKAYAADKDERKRANATKDKKKKKIDKYGKKYATGARKVMGAQALAEWQDLIHEKISKKFGLLRTGPRRERWTRDETMLRLRIAESERLKKIAEEALMEAAEKQAKIDEENEKIRRQQFDLAHLQSQREIEERALQEAFYTQLFDSEEQKARREAEFDRRQKAIDEELVQNERDRSANERATEQIMKRLMRVQTDELKLQERGDMLKKLISGDPSSRLEAVAEMELKIAKIKNEADVTSRKLQEAQKEAAEYKRKAIAFSEALRSMTLVLDQAIEWLVGRPIAEYITAKKAKLVNVLKDRISMPLGEFMKKHPNKDFQ